MQLLIGMSIKRYRRPGTAGFARSPLWIESGAGPTAQMIANLVSSLAPLCVGSRPPLSWPSEREDSAARNAPLIHDAAGKDKTQNPGNTLHALDGVTPSGGCCPPPARPPPSPHSCLCTPHTPRVPAICFPQCCLA
jgi:hypothetical protein